ncbi:MAG: type II toxin-antitoxin system MqsA family antitoxin [Lachnospiraceae bacterium]|jgi:DNA-binding transcriptional regulator YiaG|nr:type II toxin-antitoxin system MqsA family antitoxin [Lachnospiraceae bacterium]
MIMRSKGMERFAVSETMTGDEIKQVRKKLGLTQRQQAGLFNVSKKTIERWEAGKKAVTGPAVVLARIVSEYPQIVENLKIPAPPYPLRLWYLYGEEICTVIDVDEENRRLKIHNYTSVDEKCAFGRNEMPLFEEYEAFLKKHSAGQEAKEEGMEHKKEGNEERIRILEQMQRRQEGAFWIHVERNGRKKLENI